MVELLIGITATVGFAAGFVVSVVKINNKQEWGVYIPDNEYANSPASKAGSVLVVSLVSAMGGVVVVALICMTYGVILVPLGMFGALWLYFRRKGDG